MADCNCNENACVVCWPRCEECDSVLGDDEMRYCAVCCSTFDDCWAQEEEARVAGVRPVRAEALTAVEVVEIPQISETPIPEPPMTVGTIQQTFEFDT